MSDAAKFGEWQPIESTPRDGTRFWGLVGDDAIAMFWHPQFEAFVSRFNRMTLAAGLTFADTGLQTQDHSPVAHEPEYWMPIPASAERKNFCRSAHDNLTISTQD